MSANHNQSRGADYWTKKISEQEIPVLFSTVKEFEKLALDEVSSLSLLGRSILQDNALTSRVLRVANSAIYNKGVNQVSTVSRAAVVLGFDTIRNICLTAKMLTSLLESQNLSIGVYQRLLHIMAQSFQAAMLARMMVADKDDRLREEVFIASLLHRIGESAFWSMGGDITANLDEQLKQQPDPHAEQVFIRHELGTSFHTLSQGIVKSWGLGEVLSKSLAHPDDSASEIRSISISTKLVEQFSQPNSDGAELKKTLQQAADLLNIEVDEFVEKMNQCNESTLKLLDAYGANVLREYLSPTKQLLDKLNAPEKQLTVRETDITYQLAKLRELTTFATQKADFNLVMQTTLEGIFTGVGMDRCGVLLLSPNKKQLQPRVVLGDDAEQVKQDLVISLDESQSVFSRCISTSKPFWVQPQQLSSGVGIDPQMVKKLSKEGFLIAPLCVGVKVLGIFYADRHLTNREFSQTDFDSFCHFTQLANICFVMSLK